MRPFTSGLFRAGFPFCCTQAAHERPAQQYCLRKGFAKGFSKRACLPRHDLKDHEAPSLASNLSAGLMSIHICLLVRVVVAIPDDRNSGRATRDRNSGWPPPIPDGQI